MAADANPKGLPKCYIFQSTKLRIILEQVAAHICSLRQKRISHDSYEPMDDIECRNERMSFEVTRCVWLIHILCVCRECHEEVHEEEALLWSQNPPGL